MMIQGQGLRLHLGAGRNLLPGWINLDLDAPNTGRLDLREALPYPDREVSYVFMEHALEHLAPVEAWRLIQEIARVLEQEGIFRLVYPSIYRLWKADVPEIYRQAMKDRGWGDGSARSAIAAVICQHEHKSLWSFDLLTPILRLSGFCHCRFCDYGRSTNPVLDGIDGHWKEVGLEVVQAESEVIEAVRA